MVIYKIAKIVFILSLLKNIAIFFTTLVTCSFESALLREILVETLRLLRTNIAGR